MWFASWLCWSSLSVFLLSSSAGVAAAPSVPVTLEGVVALTVQRNERAQASDALAQAAASRLDRARAFFFPELAITGTYTRRLHQTTRTIGTGTTVLIQRYDALAAQANVVVPLFEARLFPLYRQVKLEGESAALLAAEQRRVLGYEAADAFLLVLGQQQVVDAAARRLEFSRKSLDEARARAEAGLVSSNDVTRTALESATAARELAAQQATAAVARLQLGYLADNEFGAEAPLVIPEALLAEAARPPGDADALIGPAATARLDVAAGSKRVSALEASALEPERRFIPSLAAVGQYRVTNEAGLGRAGDGFGGLVAAWPVFDGGERRAEASERRALARAESATQDARVRTVALDVRRAVVALTHAQSTQKVAVEASALARRNVAEAAELYRQGLARALDLADANLRLFEADVALAREKYALLLAYLDLRAATGAAPPGLKAVATGDRR